MVAAKEVLEWAFKTLEYISKHEGCSVIDISKVLNLSYPRTLNLVRVLEDLGLIKREIGGMPRKSVIVLTEKGKCLAKCLAE